MQRHQDVIVPSAEPVDPVLGRACSGGSDALSPFRGSLDERAERLECERWDALFDLQRNQSVPGDAHIQAVVGRVARGCGRIVERAGREPDMPVLGRRDLWGVGFVAADQASQLPPRLRRISDGQQKMPHHRHPVGAEDEPLDVREVQRGPLGGPGPVVGLRTRMMPSVKDPAEKPRTHRRRCLGAGLIDRMPDPGRPMIDAPWHWPEP